MNSEEEDIVIIVGAMNLIKRKQPKKYKISRKKTSIWIKPWLLRRLSPCIYSTLIEELKIESQSSYKFFLQMTDDNFLDVSRYTETDMKKQGTKFCQSIPPNIKLAATITFLVTGTSYMDLQYQFRVHQSILSGITLEVCDAICQRLAPEYLKVSRKVSLQKQPP